MAASSEAGSYRESGRSSFRRDPGALPGRHLPGAPHDRRTPDEHRDATRRLSFRTGLALAVMRPKSPTEAFPFPAPQGDRRARACRLRPPAVHRRCAGIRALCLAAPGGMSAKAGEARRQVIELRAVGPGNGTLPHLHRRLGPGGRGKGGLQRRAGAGKLPPWVALERRELSIPSNGRYRFRFEITPPAALRRGNAASRS